MDLFSKLCKVQDARRRVHTNTHAFLFRLTNTDTRKYITHMQHAHTHTHARTHTHTHTHTHALTRAHTHTRARAHAQAATPTHMHTRVHMFLLVHAHMHLSVLHACWFLFYAVLSLFYARVDFFLFCFLNQGRNEHAIEVITKVSFFVQTVKSESPSPDGPQLLSQEM